MKMKTISRFFLLLIPVLLIPILAFTTVQARTSNSESTATVSTGHFTPTGMTLLSNHTRHGITVTTYKQTFSLTGILTGTFAGTERDVLNHRTGTLTAQNRGLFTGAANGQTGTLIIIAHGSVHNGLLTGRFTVFHGTGNLEDFTGHGTFSIKFGAATGDYTLTWRMGESED